MTVERIVKESGPVVYHSLQQVVSRLTAPDVVKSIPEVKKLLDIARWNRLLDNNNSILPLKPRYPPASKSQGKMPFVVVEGLDGSGKTRVSTGLSEKLNLQLIRTPPNFIKSFKPLFDEHDESIRRAYYSLGNYLAANEVQYYSFSQGIVMDRYWHSTAAYALAHLITTNGLPSVLPSDFNWPRDLLQPDLVVFLVVSEETRRFRHAYRNTTNTKEEQTLANNSKFRKNLVDCYKRIIGPPIVEIDANNFSDEASVDENVAAIIKKVYNVVVNKLNITKLHDDEASGKLSI